MSVKVLCAAVVLAFVGFAATAHSFCEDGTIVRMYPDRLDTGVFALVESLAPGAIPNGLFYYTIHGVHGGASYTLTPHDVEQYGPVSIPQFRMAHECDALTPGCYDPGPGDDAGTIPGDGDAVVILVLGKPNSRFTYCEA